MKNRRNRFAAVSLAAVFGLAGLTTLSGCATQRDGYRAGDSVGRIGTDWLKESTRGAERGTFERVINRNARVLTQIGRSIGEGLSGPN